MIPQMTIITVPISKDTFIPILPKLPPRELNWMGKIVSWIRDAPNNGIIYRIVVVTLAIFTSFILIVSIVFSPLFIYGFKEFIRQSERTRYDKKYNELLQIASEHGRQSFLRGRLAFFDTIDINLWSETRKRIIKDLDLKKEGARHYKDIDLVRMIAAKYDDFLDRYDLKIK
jgi:hypothetical protein